MIRKFLPGRTLEIILPVTFTRDTTYWLVDQLFSGLRDQPRKVALDFSRLKKIQVGGITMLSNVIEFCGTLGITTVFRKMGGCEATDFLQGSGLLTQYLGTAADPKARTEFLPLQLVAYDKSFTHVHHQIIPWLASVFGCQERELASLKVCLEEVFNNIRDHSAVNIGCSASHYDSANGKAIICISDFGIGIPGRVRTRTALESDQAAIAKACEHGFSTRTTPRNMGAGLHVLIQNVVARNHGTVIISSGQGMYSCVTGLDGKLKGTPRAAPGKYPGTMIYITLNKSDFVPDEVDAEEFQWD